jgi:hypothetical protein
MTYATSKNLTILGISVILGALASVAAALFDGDPLTNPDFTAALTAIVAGIGNIMAKGAANTGGTVPATPEAEARVASPPVA